VFFAANLTESKLLGLCARLKSAWWTISDNLAEVRGFIGWLGGGAE
jgi:hypothetical protein